MKANMGNLRILYLLVTSNYTRDSSDYALFHTVHRLLLLHSLLHFGEKWNNERPLKQKVPDERLTQQPPTH